MSQRVYTILLSVDGSLLDEGHVRRAVRNALVGGEEPIARDAYVSVWRDDWIKSPSQVRITNKLGQKIADDFGRERRAHIDFIGRARAANPVHAEFHIQEPPVTLVDPRPWLGVDRPTAPSPSQPIRRLGEPNRWWVRCAECGRWKDVVPGNHHPYCGCGSDNFRWDDERAQPDRPID